MIGIIEARIAALGAELEKAERLIERIRGAIMVCEELLAAARQAEAAQEGPDRDERRDD